MNSASKDSKNKMYGQWNVQGMFKGQFERMNKPTNIDSYAEKTRCTINECDESCNNWTCDNSNTTSSGKRSDSISSNYSNISSTGTSPNSSPIFGRRSNSGSKNGSNTWSNIGRSKLSVSNFDINAVGPTSW